MTSHGIIQPNPALYDLESWRPRHVLVHETGQEVRESVSVAAGQIGGIFEENRKK